MIVIKNIEKKYGQEKILDGISLEVETGSIYGLVGKSGAGKSTLLRCINGLESYTAGQIWVDENEVGSLKSKDLRIFRKNIGMIFQNFSLANRISVYKNVELPLKWWKVNKEERNKRVNELLKLVGLEEKKDSKPAQLSGGKKQRVAIARALALNPKILLCDEATSALDPMTTVSILELLKSINKKLGITIIIVTHEMSVVRKICDRVAILDKGEIAVEGLVEDIFFEEPMELEELTGESSQKNYPSTGVNIRVKIVQDESDGFMLSDVGMVKKVPFKIVYSNMYDYKDKKMSIYVFNVERQYSKELEEYFDSLNVEWKEVKCNE